MELTCKSCGELIEVEEGQKTVVCDFCGLEQTLPQIDSPEKLDAFIDASDDRYNCKFDVAKDKYEKLIELYPDDNEAYWGKLLCVYGIEYVDDKLTEKKIPTCHRTLRESIFDNADYKLIISRATNEERAIYEAEAAEIDRIQKEILEIVDKSEPYDIFICYKESDEDGRRTKDSQIATKIYTNLTNKGYKVFFSRVTLKGMAGAKYEPVIYSALVSAKVMLLVSNSPAYVDARWVRNEWSRYLEFMREDDDKILVPCIGNMDAYDLPKELSEFQALNTTDMDFTENLIRQINSKFGRTEFGYGVPYGANVPGGGYPQGGYGYQPQGYQQPAPTEQTKVNSNPNQDQISNFLNRINLFIEEKDWKSANEYAEKILDINFECGWAYRAKLFCAYQVTDIDALAQQRGVEENADYKKAVRFADDELKKEIGKLTNAIEYYLALPLTKTDLTVDKNYTDAKNHLLLANGYKNANRLLAELEMNRNDQVLKKNEKLYSDAKVALAEDLTDATKYKKAKEILEKIKGFKDADKLLKELPERRDYQEKEKAYKTAKTYLSSDITNRDAYDKAKYYLEKAKDYADAEKLLAELPLARETKEKEKNYTKAMPLLNQDLTVDSIYKEATTLLSNAKGFKNADKLLEDLPRKRKEQQLEKLYDKVTSKDYLGGDLTDDNRYNETEKMLKELGDYRDSASLLKDLPKKRQDQEFEKIYQEAKVLLAKDLTNKRTYDKVKELLRGILDYKDAEELYNGLSAKRKQQEADKILAEKKKNFEKGEELYYSSLASDDVYRRAKMYLEAAGDYKNARSLLAGIDRKRNQDIADEKRRRAERNRERARDAIANADALLKGFIIMIIVGVVLAGVALAFVLGNGWSPSSETFQYFISVVASVFIIPFVIVTYVTDNKEHNKPIALVLVMYGLTALNLVLNITIGQDYVGISVIVAIVLYVLGFIFTFINMAHDNKGQGIAICASLLIAVFTVVYRMPWSDGMQWLLGLWGGGTLVALGAFIFYAAYDEDEDYGITAIVIMLIVAAVLDGIITFFIPMRIVGSIFSVEMLIVAIVATARYGEDTDGGVASWAITLFIIFAIINMGLFSSCLDCFGCGDCLDCFDCFDIF